MNIHYISLAICLFNISLSFCMNEKEKRKLGEITQLSLDLFCSNAPTKKRFIPFKRKLIPLEKRFPEIECDQFIDRLKAEEEAFQSKALEYFSNRAADLYNRADTIEQSTNILKKTSDMAQWCRETNELLTTISQYPYPKHYQHHIDHLYPKIITLKKISQQLNTIVTSELKGKNKTTEIEIEKIKNSSQAAARKLESINTTKTPVTRQTTKKTTEWVQKSTISVMNSSIQHDTSNKESTKPPLITPTKSTAEKKSLIYNTLFDVYDIQPRRRTFFGGYNLQTRRALLNALCKRCEEDDTDGVYGVVNKLGTYTYDKKNGLEIFTDDNDETISTSSTSSDSSD